jgi:hypothetical protein
MRSVQRYFRLLQWLIGPLFLFLAAAPLAPAQDFVRQQIGTTNYTTPLLQQRYNSQAFNPPLIFDIGTSGATVKNIFQVVPPTTANTTTFAVTGAGQASTITFPDPGAATGTIPYLEKAQTWTGIQTLQTPNVQLPIIADSTDTTKQLKFTLSGATTGTATTLIVSQTGNISLTAPATAGGIPVVFSCGSTGTGNQSCTPAAANTKTQIFNGQSTLSSNAATITFPSTFTSTTSYFCVANDVTTRANPVQMVPASATTATITNTTGGSDVIQWVCIGS